MNITLGYMYNRELMVAFMGLYKSIMNKKDKEFATTYIMNVLHRIKYSKTAKQQIDELLKEYGDEYLGYRRRKLHSAQHFLILGDEKTAREMCMKMRDKTNTSL